MASRVAKIGAWSWDHLQLTVLPGLLDVLHLPRDSQIGREGS